VEKHITAFSWQMKNVDGGENVGHWDYGMYVCIYIYIHTYIYTHTHTYIQLDALFNHGAKFYSVRKSKEHMS
jgi:hypothetical protein